MKITANFLISIWIFGLSMVSARMTYAHDFWITQEKPQFLLHHGHPGGLALAIDEKKIKTIKCWGTSGKIENVLPQTTFTQMEVRIKGTCLVISSFHDGGFYSLTPDGEKNLPKNQVANVVKSWRSKQYAKWLDRASPQQKTVLGDEFEIVPVTDLALVHEGDKATFQVLLQGKPIPKATFAIDHKPLGETNDVGQVRIRIRGNGLQIVSASFRRPLNSPEADSEIFESSLSFEVTK